MFKDVKEYLETTSKPKMLIKLRDKDPILKRNKNAYTFSRFNFCSYMSQVSEVFKHIPGALQVLMSVPSKQEKVTCYIIHNIFHLFFCEDIKVPIRDLILSTARELEPYLDVKDNLPVKVNKLLQLFFH